MALEGTEAINTKYFDNITKSIDNCKTCEELQTTLDKVSAPINGVTSSINAQIEKLEPVIGLLINPAATINGVINWITNYTTNYLGKQAETYYKASTQAASLVSKVSSVNEKISDVQSKIPNCSIDNPLS